MAPPTALCPGCKNEVTFQSIGDLRRCPVCGFQYQTQPAVTSSGALYEPGNGNFLGALLKGLLVVVVLIIVGIAILFAGCALTLHGL